MGGFREGLTNGRNEVAQSAFNEGFGEAAGMGFSLGTTLGIIRYILQNKNK